MDRFQQARFEPRRKSVRVDALAGFFDACEEPLWEVRGLDANELHRAQEAKSRHGTLAAILEAMKGEAGAQVDAMRKAMGLTKDTPGEVAKRLEMLVIGSVAPTIELQMAVKVARVAPVEFFDLTNTISELTGQGFDLVKPAAASQQTPASSPACDSPSSEAASCTSTAPT